MPKFLLLNSVVHGTGTKTSPGKLLEMKDLGPHPRPMNQNPKFAKHGPQWFVTPRFCRHYLCLPDHNFCPIALANESPVSFKLSQNLRQSLSESTLMFSFPLLVSNLREAYNLV